MKKQENNKRIRFVIIGFIVIAIISGIFLFIQSRKGITIIADKNQVVDTVKEVVKTRESYVSEVKRKPKKVTASVPIFMYHFLLDDYGEYPDVENFMKPETFEEQLKYITENGYETIFVNEIESLENYSKPVCLTVDDVFVYFYNNGFPLIKKYNVKVTLNIIYDYINGENYLTPAQIQEMLDSGLVAIESHTLTHQELTYLSEEEKRRQILESKHNLEKDYSIKLSTICYPVGMYDKSVINIAKEEYQYGLAMTGGTYYSDVHTNLYAIPRIYANRSMSIQTFANYLKEASVEVEW